MTDTREQTTACPECDDSDVRPKRPHAVRSDVAHRWTCRTCGARFDEPTTRPKRDQSNPRGLAGELLNADAGAVSADD